MRDANADQVVPAPGAAELASGHWAAAIRKCNEALLSNTSSADAYCIRARALRELGDLDGAIADATAAIRFNPHHAWAHRTLGDIHLIQGNPKGAIACCDEAIRLDPFLAEAYNTRAGALHLIGRAHAALVDCDQAIRLGPKLWGAYITRGNVRYHMFDPDAAEDYQVAFQINPVGYVRGVVWIIAAQVRGDPDSLFANCEKHLRLNPEETPSYTRRGVALLLLGKDDEAQRDIDQVFLLSPSSRARLTLLIAEAKRVRGGAPPGA